jgi:heat shock protein HslJ
MVRARGRLRFMNSAVQGKVRGVFRKRGEKVSSIRIARYVAMATCLVVVPAAVATPLQECSTADVPAACLDVKLKEANKLLNGALKQAQDRIEQLQRDGRRSVQTAFVNSQRTFNAYRDAQCAWQAIHAAPGESGAPIVKECQILTTLARADELQAFARGEAPAVSVAAASPASIEATVGAPAAHSQATAESASTPVAEAEQEVTAVLALPEPTAAIPAPPAAQSAAAPAREQTPGQVNRVLEWRLERWVVDGSEHALVQGSTITVAFDPSGKISGSGSVNGFNGRYGFDADGRLQWRGPGFAVTRMAAPAPLMAQERAFLETLRRMTQYGVEDGHLVLKSHSGRTVLTFVR